MFVEPLVFILEFFVVISACQVRVLTFLSLLIVDDLKLNELLVVNIIDTINIHVCEEGCPKLIVVVISDHGSVVVSVSHIGLHFILLLLLVIFYYLVKRHVYLDDCLELGVLLLGLVLN